MSNAAPAVPAGRRWLWPLALCGLFAGRLLFGLSVHFFTEDETQVFLLGLRYHASGRWPYFGPDVVWTKSEIPGALQAFLVGVPLSIAPIPESPVVLLNLLSFAALAGLAWYIGKRLPAVPRWLIWGWLFTAPWTLQFSTHIINTSYLLCAGIVFFLGFFEAMPSLRIGVLPLFAAFFMMGAALAWVVQIHMSWPLLVPYLVVAWWSSRAGGARALGTAALACVLGAAVPGVLLVPTLLRYGLQGGSGGTLRNIQVHVVGAQQLVVALARLFSFASLEINRFVATDDAKRVLFFQQHLWFMPLTAVVWLTGLVQPVWMLVASFRAPKGTTVWPALRTLVAFTVVVVYLSYCVVMEEPQAHAIYVLSPIAFIVAAYCWSLVDSARWRVVAATLLAANIAFHAGLAVIQFRTASLYTNRGVVVDAIRTRQPEMFGHRRPYDIDSEPLQLRDPSRPYNAQHDLTLVGSAVTIGLLHTANWTSTLRNTNSRVAFRDVLCVITYQDEHHQTIEQRPEFLQAIVQPGDVQHIAMNDGFVTFPFATATIEVAAADALLPDEQASR